MLGRGLREESAGLPSLQIGADATKDPSRVRLGSSSARRRLGDLAVLLEPENLPDTVGLTVGFGAPWHQQVGGIPSPHA